MFHDPYVYGKDLGALPTRCLIKNQYRRIPNDGSSNSNTLLLATTHLHTTLPTRCHVSLWKEKLVGVKIRSEHRKYSFLRFLVHSNW